MTAEPITKIVLPSGGIRYEVVVDVGVDPATGRRRQRRSRFSTRREARSWLAKARVAAESGTYIDRSRMTVDEYLRQWVASRLNIRPGTRASYTTALRPWREQLGAVQLTALTKAQVERVRDGLLDGSLRRAGRAGTPLAPRSVRLALQVFQQALDQAMRDEVITRNVVALVERPGGGTDAGAAWTEEQTRRFAAVASRHRLHAAWLLALHGLRRSEVSGLRWDDVDLQAKTISIRQVRVVVDREVIVGPPKTKRGHRTLPLPADVIDALRRLKVVQGRERLEAGLTYVGEGYVLADELGRAMHPAWFSSRFAVLASAAGCPPVRLHDLRHSSVSIKRSLGWPDHLVAAWHGHDEAVMKAVYTHTYMDDLRRHAEALGQGL